MKNVRRGDVWLADLGNNEGSEQRGIRPVLIIQNNVGNHFSPTVIVAAITDFGKRYMPTHVVLQSGARGLHKDSQVLLEQIRTIDKQKLIKKIYKLPAVMMLDVDYKIKISLGLVPVEEARLDARS